MSPATVKLLHRSRGGDLRYAERRRDRPSGHARGPAADSETASSNTTQASGLSRRRSSSPAPTDHHGAAGHGTEQQAAGPWLESRRRHRDAPPDPYRRDALNDVAVEPAPGQMVRRRAADLPPAGHFGPGPNQPNSATSLTSQASGHSLAHVPSDGPTEGPDTEGRRFTQETTAGLEPQADAAAGRSWDLAGGFAHPAVGGHQNVPAGSEQTLAVGGHLVHAAGAGGGQRDSPARCHPRAEGRLGVGPPLRPGGLIRATWTPTTCSAGPDPCDRYQDR